MEAQIQSLEPPADIGGVVAKTKTTVKKAERSKRIWLEGKRLPKAGFEIGSRFFLRHRKTELHLELHPDGDRKIISAVRTANQTNFQVNRPVLKLDSEVIGLVFEVGEEVEVFFYDGLIVMKRPTVSSANRLLQMRWVPQQKGDEGCN